MRKRCCRAVTSAENSGEDSAPIAWAHVTDSDVMTQHTQHRARRSGRRERSRTGTWRHILVPGPRRARRRRWRRPCRSHPCVLGIHRRCVYRRLCYRCCAIDHCAIDTTQCKQAVHAADVRTRYPPSISTIAIAKAFAARHRSSRFHMRPQRQTHCTGTFRRSDVSATLIAKRRSSVDSESPCVEPRAVKPGSNGSTVERSAIPFPMGTLIH